MFGSYLNRISYSGNSVGSALKSQSDLIMEATWDNDIQSKPCYIYDYYHDDEKAISKGMHPENSVTKTRVDAKFIVSQYDTVSKDQVEYHLQFKPSHECELDYYEEKFANRYGADYPVGLYIDIPDENGIYHKWLICSRDRELQFIKYIILPCNYHFMWVINNTKYNMWGVARLRNSYNSGVWTDWVLILIRKHLVRCNWKLCNVSL